MDYVRQDSTLSMSHNPATAGWKLTFLNYNLGPPEGRGVVGFTAGQTSSEPPAPETS